MGSSSPSPHRPIPRRRLRDVLAALLYATAFCGALMLIRFRWAHTLELKGLFGNLLLAWIPLLLSLVLLRQQEHVGWRKAIFRLTGVLWFLFFPNSFYILTDLIHTRKFGSSGVAPWFDMLMTATFAFGGAFLGCLSLYLVHWRVRHRFGVLWSWCFAMAVLCASAIGIYLGRYLRLNSWDVIRPLRFWEKVQQHFQGDHPLLAYPLAIFLFSCMAYWFVVAMARLHEDEI